MLGAAKAAAGRQTWLPHVRLRTREVASKIHAAAYRIQAGRTTGQMRSVLTGLAVLSACASLASAANNPPTVDAGPLQSVYEDQAVHLHADASDPDGDPLAYAWTQEAGAIVTLGGETTADASFTCPMVATVTDASMTFEVTVNDGGGGTAYDIVNVWVYLAGDANRNDAVDVSDLLMLADAWDSRLGDANYNALCDFNTDGSVDASDLLALAGSWGRQLQ
jgi:hypothetical protein